MFPWYLLFAFFFTLALPTVLPVHKEIVGLINKTITIEFSIKNAKKYNIHWKFKPLGSEIFNSTINARALSPDQLSLTISNVQLKDRGVYKIIVSNEVGTREATTFLDVYGKFMFFSFIILSCDNNSFICFGSSCSCT